MKELIRFSLARKMKSRMMVIFNVLLLIIMGLLFHIDYLVKPMSSEVRVIVVDGTAQEKAPALTSVEHSDFTYVTTGKGEENEALLYYEDGWYIQSEAEISEKLLCEIESDIRKACSQDIYNKTDIKTRLYIDKYLSETLVKVSAERQSEDNPCWVILSLVFFLVLSYGNMVGNDLIYEKATHVLPLTLICIKPGEHFAVRIITGYLSVVIQMVAGALMGLFWIAVRYFGSGFTGLENWLIAYVVQDSQAVTVNADIRFIILGLLIILLGLLTVQTVMLVITSRFSNSEEASAFQGPMYLVMILVYYAFLVWGKTSFFTSSISTILSYIPVSSMIFAPCRILLGNMTGTETVISIGVAIVFLGVTVRYLMPIYGRNLLNK